MKIGTKSVLFGAHFFLTHWLFIAFGWWKLYGFRRVYIGERVLPYQEQRWREQVANTVPGYFRAWTMPARASLWDVRLWVAFVIHDLGYWGKPNMDGDEGETHPEWAARKMAQWFGKPWGELCLYHSRFYAKRDNHAVSVLCYADKLAIAYEPWWFYLPRVIATGEVNEYMAVAQRKETSKGYTANVTTRKAWYRGIQVYMKQWVEEHKDGRADTWTQGGRRAVDTTGTWQ